MYCPICSPLHLLYPTSYTLPSVSYLLNTSYCILPPKHFLLYPTSYTLPTVSYLVLHTLDTAYCIVPPTHRLLLASCCLHLSLYKITNKYKENMPYPILKHFKGLCAPLRICDGFLTSDSNLAFTVQMVTHPPSTHSNQYSTWSL